VRAFFDSNILIYAFSTDSRRQRAQEVLSSGGVISVQVLNEFTNVLRRKQKQDWQIIEASVLLVRSLFPLILPLTANTHAFALGLARDHSLRFYDALIVTSAREAGCDTLLSEDMQHERRIGALTIRNPFIEDVHSPRH
jgi:predicted nucleic acid-binding protein